MYPQIPAGSPKAQNITVLVTDAVDTANLSTEKPDILADKKKNEATVFAYYAGNMDPKQLEPIPDYELMALGEIEQSLNAYFKGIGLFLKKQDVFLVKPESPVVVQQAAQAVGQDTTESP